LVHYCSYSQLCQSFLHVLFFFSSRRRHTRCYRDWSSDVCSSDLEAQSNSVGIKKGDLVVPTVRRPDGCLNCQSSESDMCLTGQRSEERRVGKECRRRG